MRRVTFTLSERLELVGVEVVGALKWGLPVLLLAVLLTGSDWTLSRLGAVLPVMVGLLAGTVLVPILLPWIPGRAFSLKGALVGAAAVGAAIALTAAEHTVLGNVQLFLLGTAAASFFAMQFTGATTFTSPSGVSSWVEGDNDDGNSTRAQLHPRRDDPRPRRRQVQRLPALPEGLSASRFRAVEGLRRAPRTRSVHGVRRLREELLGERPERPPGSRLCRCDPQGLADPLQPGLRLPVGQRRPIGSTIESF
jgi:hypothetical protein